MVAPEELIVSLDELSPTLDRAVLLEELGIEDPAVPARHVPCQPAIEFRGRISDWIQEVRQARERGDQILFIAGTQGRVERTIEVLRDYSLVGINLDRAEDSHAAAVLVATGRLSRGFRLPDASLQIWAETDLFEEEFKKTFPGLRLVLVHPMARAGKLIPEELKQPLEQANRATSPAVLDQIRSNQWLGQDFLLWLLYRSMTDAGDYRVNQPGSIGKGEAFAAFLDDRLVLMSTTEEGAQKMTVAGPQGRFGEVHTALQNGKKITEATIHLEQEENSWKVTLKAERFYFASFRCPPVHLEKDNTVDQASEQEAVFYERMHLLESGLQLFDSLFADFLGNRLDSGWATVEAEMQAWLARNE